MDSTQDPAGQATIELLGRVRAGDREALEELAKRYMPRLKRMAHGRLPPFARDEMDTDCLVQETWMRTLKDLERVESNHEFAFSAYLRRTVMNLVQNEVRNAMKRPQWTAVPPAELDRAPSPLDEVIGRQARDRYEAALERLSKECRELIILRLELNCSYDEIATAIGKPSAVVARMAVSRAVTELAEEMRQSEETA